MSDPVANKVFLFVLAAYYIYMPVHFFFSNQQEQLVKIFLWVNMSSFYFMPLILLTLRFTFEMQSVLRNKEYNELVDIEEQHDRLRTDSSFAEKFDTEEQDYYDGEMAARDTDFRSAITL